MLALKPHHLDTPHPPPPETPPRDDNKNKNKNKNITITLLPDPSPVYASALTAWTSLYSTKTSNPHPSLTTFKTTYSHPNGRLLLASTPTTPIAGIVAYRTYDNRFTHPDLTFPDTANVVEVARLFVEPALRGQGIATLLVRALVRMARVDGVRVMYLHTHPFLPGAEALWEKEGWRVVVREEAGPWWTVHMRRDLEG